MFHACPTCGPVSITPAQQVGGKLALTAAGAMLGAHVGRDPIVVLICAFAGMWLGHQIDLRCPGCGAVLQLAQTVWG
jgi:hypothetical protein